MKIPDGWFQRLFDLGKRAKKEVEDMLERQHLARAADALDVAGAEQRTPAAHDAQWQALIEQYSADLQGLARELEAETEKERRAAKVAELGAVILSGTLLGSMDREAVIKAAAVARQLLDEAAGVKELPS